MYLPIKFNSDYFPEGVIKIAKYYWYDQLFAHKNQMACL